MSAVADTASLAALMPGPEGLKPFEGAIPSPPLHLSGDVLMEAGPTPRLPMAAPSPGPFFAASQSGRPSSATTLVPTSGIELSLARLESKSHNVRLQQARQVQSNSQMANTYERHVRNYKKWWNHDQGRRGEI